MFCAGPDAEARLEDGRHHPRAQEGDQDHEHGAVRAHDGLAAGADGAHRADAGEPREAFFEIHLSSLLPGDEPAGRVCEQCALLTRRVGPGRDDRQRPSVRL